MRDLWDYQLKLTPAQIKLIIAHAYELERAEFDYYFFNDNCAHRIINLIEIVTQTTLSKTHGFWLMPVQTVQQLKQADLIAHETYIPSLHTQTTLQFNQLSKHAKRQINHYLKNTPQTAKLTTWDSPTLLTALNKLNVKLAELSMEEQNQTKMQHLQSYRQPLLAELFTRKATDITPVKLENNASLLELGPISSLTPGLTIAKGQTRATLRYQIAHNDLLSQPMPNAPPSRFIMGAFELESTGDHTKIRQVELLDILNLSENLAWQYDIGYTTRDTLCKACSTFNTGGKIGKAKHLSSQTTLYGLAGARAHHKRSDAYDYLVLEADIGMIQTLTPRLKTHNHLKAAADPLNGNPTYLLSSETAYQLNPHQQLKLGIEHDFKQTAASLTFGFYFN